MAKVQVEDLYIPQGGQYIHTFIYPANIYTRTFSMQFREDVESDTILYSAETGTGEFTASYDAENDETTIILTISAAVTANWTFTKVKYDIEARASADDIIKLIKGSVKIEQEITR